VLHLHGADEFRDRLLSRADRARLTIAAAEIDRLEVYYHLLTRWNRAINLTALSLDPLGDNTIDRLFMEPLAMAFHVPHVCGECFDLGSGGGSPAIPLKIVRPLLKLTMVEARERKAAFLREVTRDLGMTDAAVVNGRLEALEHQPDLHGVAAFVTARAVRVDAILVRISRHLLSRSNGRLLLLGGSDAHRDALAMFESVETFELPVGGGAKLVIAKG
jgi:16S rRNA (guanine527-N7)-methyltransferase